MAAGTSVWSDIESFAGTIYEAGMLVIRDNAVITQLCRYIGDATGMMPRKNSEYGTATMGSIADTDDLSSEAFAPTVLSTLTPVEYGTQFLLTDQRVESDPFNVTQDAARELGEATANKYETELAAVFSSFTGGTLGSAGGTLSLYDHYKAAALLRARNAPQPYYAVYTPMQWFRMVGTVAPVGSVSIYGLSDALTQRFFMGNVGGVLVFLSNNIAVGTASVGAVFSSDALAIDMRRAARLEYQRDASKRAWELNQTTVFATGVWKPTYGVKMTGTGVVS